MWPHCDYINPEPPKRKCVDLMWTELVSLLLRFMIYRHIKTVRQSSETLRLWCLSLPRRTMMLIYCDWECIIQGLDLMLLSAQVKRLRWLEDLFQCLPTGFSGWLQEEQPGEAVLQDVCVQVSNHTNCLRACLLKIGLQDTTSDSN